MKITFPLPTDNATHTYCPHCGAEAISSVTQDGATRFACSNCHQVHDRVIQIGPGLTWWVDAKTHELWHESAGLVIVDESDRILVFERLIYPRQTTFPAGHVKAGEDPAQTVLREASEEVGLSLTEVEPIGDDAIPGDRCSRGADFHQWHLYRTRVADGTRPQLTGSNEGHRAVWLTLDQLRATDTPPAVRFMLKKYGSQLLGLKP